MQWFRMYAEFATDPTVQCLSFDDQRHFVILLCLKSAGVLDRDYGADSELRRRVLKRALGLEGMAFDEASQRLIAASLVTEDLSPKNWNKRQFVNDSSAERTRKWRKNRDKKEKSLRRHGDVTVTPSESDTDTEKTKRENAPSVLGLDAMSWERFFEYRKSIKKPIKAASILAAQKKLASYGIDQAAVVEQTVANSWTGLFDLSAKPKKASGDWQ